ncbi:MAG: 6-phosphogluconolactonase [Opitutaceae bacterium]|nr:6-phosphogluconolactonase [Opitutaceae bacterium]
MKLVVLKDPQSVADTSAAWVAKALLNPSVRNVQPAMGNSPQELYARLPRLLAGHLDEVRARLRVYQMDEYADLLPGDDRLLATWMAKTFTGPLGISRENVFYLLGFGSDPEASCRAFDFHLEGAGGLDVLVAGLGPNGHVGFNEPPSAPDTPSRMVPLAPESIRSNATYWGGEDRVPPHAVTTGLGPMLRARATVFVVNGAHKRNILEQTLLGPVSDLVPASHFREQNNVVLVADRAACPEAIESRYVTLNPRSRDHFPALFGP